MSTQPAQITRTKHRARPAFQLNAAPIPDDVLDRTAQEIGEKYGLTQNTTFMEEIRYGLGQLSLVSHDFLKGVAYVEANSEACIADRSSNPPRVFFENVEREKARHADNPQMLRLLSLLDDIDTRKNIINGRLLHKIAGMIPDELAATIRADWPKKDETPDDAAVKKRAAFAVLGTMVRQTIDHAKTHYHAEVNFSKAKPMIEAKKQS